MKEFPFYKSQYYIVKTPDKSYTGKAFLVTVANSSQYGNNALIAPQASAVDGKFNIAILKKFPFYAFPSLAYKLFNGTLQKSKYIEYLEADTITINQFHETVHTDGEPSLLGKELSIKLNPLSLNVLVPQSTNG